MKRGIVFGFLLVMMVGALQSQVPNVIPYQGLLTLSSGTPVSNGSYDLKFELFNVPSGGSALWNETQSGITLKNGTFAVNLGAVTVLPALFSQQLYLQVTALAGPSIGGATIFPRTMLGSVPYSLSLYLPFSGSTTQPAGNSSFAVSNSGAGTGIKGSHDSTSGTAPGVLGQTNSTSGSALAVEGIVTSSSPGGFSTAVRGMNNGTGGLGIGVWGSQSGSGWGVYGSTPSGYSVYGVSNSGTGVVGSATSGTGVYGYSASGLGGYLSSTSNYGLQAASQTSVGVYSTSHTSTAVYGASDSSVGVWGYSGSGAPAVLSWGQLAVVGSGDNSVTLPNDAINSQEIFDEPGIAASYSSVTFLTGLGTNRRIDSVVITVPAPGKIVVQATGYVNCNHTKGSTDNYAFVVATDPTADPYVSGVSTFLIPDSLPSRSGGFAYRYPFAVNRLFNAPSAGSYKIYLVGLQYSGDNSASAALLTSTIATYYPTVYGSTPVSQPPSATIGDGASLSSTSPVQYETVQQFNDAKSAALQRTVDQLQQRVQSLEAMMSQMKAVSAPKTSQSTPNQ